MIVFVFYLLFSVAVFEFVFIIRPARAWYKEFCQLLVFQDHSPHPQSCRTEEVRVLRINMKLLDPLTCVSFIAIVARLYMDLWIFATSPLSRMWIMVKQL